MAIIRRKNKPVLLLLTLGLLVLISVIPTTNARVKGDGGGVQLKMKTGLTPPTSMCIGESLDFNFFFILDSGMTAPALIPRSDAVVNISTSNGKVNPMKFVFPKIFQNQLYNGSFKYTAKSKGSEVIKIKATTGQFKAEVDIKLKVGNCKATVQFTKQKNLSYDIVTINNIYSGSGVLSVDDDGKISGSGSQVVWGTILPYSSEEGSCTQDGPWDGESAISFSGESSEGGEVNAVMELASLSINSTSLTCSGEDYSASMPFPGYTYAECQVQLEGFDFEGGSLDIPINCPGEDPYDLTITIIPRRET